MPSPAQRTLIGVGLAVLFAACVWPAIGAYFTADDFVCLTRSRAPDPVSALRYFARDWGGSREGGVFYRPLGAVSLSLDGWLFGLRPAAFRVSGLLLHLAVTFLVGFVGRRRWRLSPPAALLAAALFLLHPLHDQAVLWIAARTDLLCALFMLLAFQAATGERGAWVGVAFFAAALATKESAITLPALVLAHGLLVGRPGAGPYEAWRRAGTLAAVVPFYLLLRHVILGGVVIHGDAAFLRGGTALVKSAAKLLLWIFVPLESNTLEGALRGVPGGLPVAGALVLAGVLALALLTLRQHRRHAACLLWVVLALGPVLARPHSWYTYLPSAGFCWLLAGWLHPDEAPTRPRLGLALAVIALFALGLSVNTRRFRAAADLSETVVSTLAPRTGTVLLVNPPAVLHGRYPVLTAPGHYAEAMALVGSRARVVLLTHAYLRTGREHPQAQWRPDALNVAMETGEESFFVLDELVKAMPGRLEPGRGIEGLGVSYRVDRLDARGRIAALTVRGFEPFVDPGAVIAEYGGGRLAVRPASTRPD